MYVHNLLQMFSSFDWCYLMFIKRNLTLYIGGGQKSICSSKMTDFCCSTICIFIYIFFLSKCIRCHCWARTCFMLHHGLKGVSTHVGKFQKCFFIIISNNTRSIGSMQVLKILNKGKLDFQLSIERYSHITLCYISYFNLHLGSSIVRHLISSLCLNFCDTVILSQMPNFTHNGRQKPLRSPIIKFNLVLFLCMRMTKEDIKCQTMEDPRCNPIFTC